MITIQILAVVLILAIAYKKEIVALFKKVGERIEKNQKDDANAPAKKRGGGLKKFFNSIDFLSDETKRFLRILCGVIIYVVLLISIFLVCHLLFPEGAGYALGSVIDIAVIFAVVIVTDFD